MSVVTYQGGTVEQLLDGGLISPWFAMIVFTRLGERKRHLYWLTQIISIHYPNEIEYATKSL